MSLKSQAGRSERDKEQTEELEYLYKRLFTLNNLIRAFEEYDLHRPKASQWSIREKTA
jgi:hypothetical protein